MKITTPSEGSREISTLIPARLDRLPWSSFHWRVLAALGITWILDGLEVTLTGTFSSILQDPATLNFTGAEIGLLGSSYVAGAVLGALYFGYLTDLIGRKKLFFITLSVYIVGVFLSALSWNLWSFMLFRFVTGAGIGGEYAAINSAIDELIPARVRGRVGLSLNGSYWIGAALGSVSTLFFLNPRFFDVDVGWRIGFGVGAVVGLAILYLREFVPESPRWLVLHGREGEAERILKDMENSISEEAHRKLGPVNPNDAIRMRPRGSVGLKVIFKAMFTRYRERSILGLSLMASQAFLYNAIFFTYVLVLTKFYDVPAKDTGLYILPFAIGNFLGPLLLGRLFDTVGRRKMITLTYGLSAALLALTGWWFVQGYLTATTQTLMWSVIFFFASAAASSAYLTVSEIFPLEMRALAIAMFYAVGTGIGGVLAPWIFGILADSGSREAVTGGYLLAGALMAAAAVVEWKIGVDSEGRSLESISMPLSALNSDESARS